MKLNHKGCQTNVGEAENVFSYNKKKTTYISDAILLVIGLLVFNEYIVNNFQKLRQKFPKIIFINATMITTTIGILAGTIVKYMNGDPVLNQIQEGFAQIFLIILLPPILFESAIHMDTYTFFQHFGSINIYAIYGTILAMLITSILMFFGGIFDFTTSLPLNVCFTYGAIISSTDPVAVLTAFKNMKDSKMLYTFIFGESILNDAVAIILFQAVIQIQTREHTQLMSIFVEFIKVFSVSIFVGYTIGLLSAFMIRSKFQSVSNYESSILILLPWVTYLISEALSMSGIMSIIFCGISMGRYSIPRISEENQKMLAQFYGMVSNLFENSIFILIGIGIVGFDLAWNQMGIGLLISVTFAINLGRFLNIFTSTQLTNHYRSNHKINDHQMFIMWFSGLRGAMAYALSLQCVNIYSQDGVGKILLTLTLSIIVINIYIQGSLLEPLLNKYQQFLIEKYDVTIIENQNIFRKIKDSISGIDFLIQSTILQGDNDEFIKQDDEIQ